MLGMVTPDHPLFTWLLRNGAAPRELADIAARPIALDIMGLNFYPQWSAKSVYLDTRGRVAYRIPDPSGAGFETLLADHYRRYGCPIMVTETSAHGSPEVRTQWLKTSLDAVKSLRERGVPVIGYTWFPLFTMIDWAYRSGKRPLKAYRIGLGLYELVPGEANARWLETPVVDDLRGDVQNTEQVVGTLIVSD